MPTNFRTYEAQSRLLAAVLAAHPELKLNYKEIARVFGSSTPDGIQFQFRAIKKEATGLLEAANNGTAAFPQTPKKATKTKDAPGSGKTGTPTTAGNSRTKRKAAPRNLTEVDHKESDSQVVDYDTLEVTPLQKKMRTQPSITTSPGFEDTVKAIDDAPAVGRAPQMPRTTHRQQATPSETDGSAQTSPMLKEEADFGCTDATAARGTNLAPATATETSPLFPGSSMSSSGLPASFTHFGGNQPDAFTFSFASSDHSAKENSGFSTDFGDAESFGYSHQSFTDGEV